MSKPPCTYPDCRQRGPQYAHLLCKNCYDRLLYRPNGRNGMRLTGPGLLILAQAGRGRDECWPWPGYVDDRGYAMVGQGWAHRLAVTRAGIELPPGFDVDHECHNRDASCMGGPTCLHRRCVNYRHLRPVPASVNRSNNARTRSATCSNGHLKSEYRRVYRGGAERCTACDRAVRLARTAREGAA